EILLEGSNHAKIGSKMAEKWNLPVEIVNIIKYHENPLAAPDEVRDITKMVYLAHIVDKKINPEDKVYDLEEDMIIDHYGLTGTEDLDNLVLYVKNQLSRVK
nr:HDOD domain-containing protein [Spirochaetota bacterium]